MRVAKGLGLGLVLAAMTIGTAGAQVTAEQQSAIRANCRGDFMSKCSGVTPGGKEALTCLQKNVDALSAGCKSAVSATLPAPAPAAAAPAPKLEAVAPAAPPRPAPAATAPPAAPVAPSAPAPAVSAPSAPQIAKPAVAAKRATPKSAAVTTTTAPTAAQQDAMRSACRSDFVSKCTGVTPGGKDALACLQKNVGTLSPGCKTVVSATIAGAPAVIPAATAPAAAAAAPSITPEQMSAVKFTCRADFGRYCKGVAPGGAEALGCLQNNAARLMPDCKTSIAAIADEIPAATTTAAAPAAAATAAAPQRKPPGITPAGRILRRVMERAEQKQQQ
jgi:hypothetical protein